MYDMYYAWACQVAIRRGEVLHDITSANGIILENTGRHFWHQPQGSVESVRNEERVERRE